MAWSGLATVLSKFGKGGDDYYDDEEEEYLDDEYRPSEIWNMTEEEKEIKIEDFIDEIFSWLCDDYQEVELKED